MLQQTTNMKSIKYIILALLASLAVACDFDDSSLQERLADIQERIAALQADIDDFNEQLEALSYLTSGNVITSVTVDSDGYYVVTYKTSDDVEQTVVIATMSQMINVPVLGVELDESNNLYYWTVTVDGETSYLTVDGEKVPVAGYTPTISADSEGYWTVDGVRITDSEGNPIPCRDGESCVFQSVSIDDDGNLVITQGNGTVITIPVQDALNLVLDSDVSVTVVSTSVTISIGYSVSGTNADDAIVAIAELSGINAVLDEDSGVVKVSFDDDFTDGYLIMLAYDMAEHTVLRPVFFSMEETEDEEERGIRTADDLVALAAAVNSGDENTVATYMDETGAIRLLCDIDMSEVTSWTPIGEGTCDWSSNVITITGNPFTGHFDGQGYSIMNFDLTYTNETSLAAIGLFGVIGTGAVVENIVFDSSCSLDVTSSVGCETGILAGVVLEATVSNIVNNAPLTFTNTSATVRQTMGIMGFVYARDYETVIEEVVNYGAVTGYAGSSTQNGAAAVQIGGICGFSSNEGTSTEYVWLTDCVNYGDISGTCARASGIVGAANRYTYMSACINYGDNTNSFATSSNARIGNVSCVTGSGSVMEDCINYGDIISTTSGGCGGLVCLVNHKSNEFIRCKSYGMVISDRSGYVGTFFGQCNLAASFEDCVAGGAYGTYNDGEHSMVEITEDNYMSYIGTYSSAATGVRSSSITFAAYTSE